ncbi:hypothetical protein [uncultured Kordia sp.]|uniref:hypothetical protein n=1 Tax=uncultured Kordia sp. TaxID=507699 RepID=UPI00262C6E48|nr:hypothetical protein [uncultured Kordia sp.]
MNRAIYILLLSFFFIQCDVNEKDKDKAVPFNDVDGKYIHLETENIYLFVPKKVKLFSISQYKEFIDSIEDPRVRKIERDRYLNMKYGIENTYVMRSEDLELDVTYMSIPYIRIDQSVSQTLLQLLNRQHKKNGKVFGLESSFSRAGIIKKGHDRIFRAIFLYKGIEVLTGEDAQIYTYFYVINRNGKTFVLSFNSKKVYDFDSYVQKIKL